MDFKKSVRIEEEKKKRKKKEEAPRALVSNSSDLLRSCEHAPLRVLNMTGKKGREERGEGEKKKELARNEKNRPTAGNNRGGRLLIRSSKRGREKKDAPAR